MNSFATIALVYAIFTFVSSSLLYVSFKNKIDESAFYFFISELLMACTSMSLFLTNMQMLEAKPIVLSATNFSALAAEVAITLSILSLKDKVEKKWSFVAFLSVAMIAFFLELIRGFVGFHIIVLISSVSFTILFLLTFLISKYQLPPSLSKNQFIKMFTWFSLGMVAYGIVRIIGSFFPVPITLRHEPNIPAVIVFSIFLVLGTFRYISYICLRITWADPEKPTQNMLNEPFIRIIEEKDRLLSGLIASNRMVGLSALASSLSHQLSQPLTTISLRADTARRYLLNKGGSSHALTSLDEIANQSSNLVELVKSLHNLFGKKSASYAPLSLQKIIDEIIEIVNPSLESKKIRLRKYYRDNPFINGDSIQIQQVLINILNNAIDAITPNQSNQNTIYITLTCDTETAMITVMDTGSGIDQSLMPTIFDLYKTTKQNGLGIGLWLSKSIVESHHGTITATNRPDGGAEFKIAFPIYKDASE